MSAPRPPRKWEDIEVGETTRSSPVTVTEEAIVTFARQYDPQYFHSDPEAAKASAFGGLIASGIHTAALWRIMDHEVNGNIDFVQPFAELRVHRMLGNGVTKWFLLRQYVLWVADFHGFPENNFSRSTTGYI